MTITVSYLLNLAKRFGKSVCFIGNTNVKIYYMLYLEWRKLFVMSQNFNNLRPNFNSLKQYGKFK